MNNNNLPIAVLLRRVVLEAIERNSSVDTS